MGVPVRTLLKTQINFLLFRPIRPDLEGGYWSYFLFIVVVTWLVGIGRYWDHPSAEIWQYAGLGSVIYIFVLAAVLYVIVLPLGPRNWRYSRVLLFVGLTSLPAALYAFPIEKFVTLKTAQATNAWFLAIVAAWRVALYVRYLRTSARLNWFFVIVATLLPLSGIVVLLTTLNLEHVVFSIMGGIRDIEESPYDTAYEVVFLLSVLAVVAFPITAILYVGSLFYRMEVDESET